MIDAADVLNSHFDALADSLAGVDLAGIDEAAWQLLIEIERLDRSLAPIPDNAPDFSRYKSPRDLAAAAQQHIDRLDSRLIRAQRAQAALLPLLGAFEQAREASEAAEYITREIDRFILTLER